MNIKDYTIKYIRDHAILDGICSSLNDEHMAISQEVIDQTLFVYPKTIYIQLEGMDIAGNVAQEHDEIVKFARAVATYSAKNNFNLNMLLDLRSIQVLNESAFESLIQFLKGNEIETLIWASIDLRNEMNTMLSATKVVTCYSENDVVNQLLETARRKTKTIILPENVTLEFIIERINQEVERSSKGCALISLDFRSTRVFNGFAVLLLSLVMLEFSKRFGVLWFIEHDEAERHKLHKLESVGFFSLTKTIVLHEYEIEEYRDLNVFGAYELNSDNFREIVQSFVKWIIDLRERFAAVLDENISVMYENPHTSYKPSVRRLPKSYYIRRIAAELIENSILHSEGSAYFSAYVNADLLHIFVADTGIGLGRGILKNYRLGDKIKTDDDALHYAFQLHNFQDTRIGRQGYDIGAGYGLRETFEGIFTCSGKFACKSGRSLGTFLNPVSRTSRTPKMNKYETSFALDGVQYLILIPLSSDGIQSLPRSSEKFLSGWSKNDYSIGNT
ncbi:MAG: hypothetical protein P8171_21820 [Candidatus Thiodiazotropha sp.]